MINDKENRRSFRVSESALIDYEIIDEADFEKGLERWNIRAGTPSCIRARVLDLDARLHEVLYRVKNDAPSCHAAIELLNEKISFVLDVLPEYNQFKQGLGKRPAQRCQLSSEGMLFECDELLPAESKLLLRFLLVSDNRFFETFCRVIRVVDEDGTDSDNGPRKHRIAVEFHDMGSAEREVLIQHLFSKQSEKLRSRRKQSDAEQRANNLLPQ